MSCQESEAKTQAQRKEWPWFWFELGFITRDGAPFLASRILFLKISLSRSLLTDASSTDADVTAHGLKLTLSSGVIRYGTIAAAIGSLIEIFKSEAILSYGFGSMK